MERPNCTQPAPAWMQAAIQEIVDEQYFHCRIGLVSPTNFAAGCLLWSRDDLIRSITHNAGVLHRRKATEPQAEEKPR